MIYGAGVDVGSTQTKAVILSSGREIVSRALAMTGANVTKAAERTFSEALAASGLPREKIGYIIGTGYGRYKVTFGDSQVTEISCHARGAHFMFPNTRTVIDIGGQDTKAIRVGTNGEVVDFAMNDKCAAGTGRFLSASAEVLDLPLEKIGALSLEGKEPVRLSTVCTVFVESDIMSYLAQGKKTPDILAGVHRAIAARTISLLQRIGLSPEYTMTGGVARNIGMVNCLEEKLKTQLNVSADSHFMGAIGAALFALERAELASRGKREEAVIGGWEDGLQETKQ
ncbi:MAG: 2-hydroxyglutaryl-CoA dehydratase [Candidatus Brocadiae bacterium]|nr:2-hydroxyglutaryl-CoA dehydratase [Candidatus Brocadiia bacterium]